MVSVYFALYESAPIAFRFSSFDTETNLLDVFIQRLRRKVDDGEATNLIQTVRGVGYRIGDLT